AYNGVEGNLRDTEQMREEILLEKVAWYLHNGRRQSCNKGDLPERIAKLLPNNRDSNISIEIDRKHLEEIIEQDSVLTCTQSGIDGECSFLYHPLQVYFVGRYVKRIKGLRNTLLGFYDELWWEEVVLIYTTMLVRNGEDQEDIEFFVRQLLEKEDVF